jgi:hypothetical protein
MASSENKCCVGGPDAVERAKMHPSRAAQSPLGARTTHRNSIGPCALFASTAGFKFNWHLTDGNRRRAQSCFEKYCWRGRIFLVFFLVQLVLWVRGGWHVVKVKCDLIAFALFPLTELPKGSANKNIFGSRRKFSSVGRAWSKFPT